MKLTVGIILHLFLFICKSQEISVGITYNYYWRDYTGVVPEDAVPGGYDLNEKTTYIGQGFLKDSGIMPTTIYPGEKSILVSDHGVKTISTYIRILCSPQPLAFSWVPVKADNFHLKMINKHAVRGGIEDYRETNYTLNIGRIAFQGEVVVGKIVTGSLDTPDLAPMYYASKGTERRIDSYEALVYDPSLNFLLDVRRGEAITR